MKGEGVTTEMYEAGGKAFEAVLHRTGGDAKEDARYVFLSMMEKAPLYKGMHRWAIRRDFDEHLAEQYAIEHAGYLANAAEAFIKAVNEDDLQRLRIEEEDGEADPEAAAAAAEDRLEAATNLRRCIYEFRKRAAPPRRLATPTGKTTRDVQGRGADDYRGIDVVPGRKYEDVPVTVVRPPSSADQRMTTEEYEAEHKDFFRWALDAGPAYRWKGGPQFYPSVSEKDLWRGWKARAERGVTLEADARRYRWLREQQWDTAGLFVIAGSKDLVRLGTDCPSLERLDAAIDAAMATRD